MLRIFFIITVCFTLGCSSLLESAKHSLLGDEAHKTSKKRKKLDSKASKKWVSKSQYDGLFLKYQNLQDKYERLKDEKVTSKDYDQLDELSTLEDKDQSKKSSSLSNTSNTMSDKISETIDLFSKDGKLKTPVSTTSNRNDNRLIIPEESIISLSEKIGEKEKLRTNGQVEKNLATFNKAQKLLANNKIDEALKLFQYLERQGSRQLKVHASYEVALIYMKKKEFDLALQVFEKILFQNAFSGKIISALQKSIVCCDKLNLQQKKMKYQSILRDFFEVNPV